MVVKKIKTALSRRFRLLANPEKGFAEYSSFTFENILYEYLLMLVFVGLMSGIFTFLAGIIRSLYLDFFFNAEVQYWNMLNYALGKANGTMFFYFFAGTFLLFIVSIILNVFIRKAKYTKILEILLISLTPILLFGWIPALNAALAVWCLILLIIGLKTVPKLSKTDKYSIKQRD